MHGRGVIPVSCAESVNWKQFLGAGQLNNLFWSIEKISIAFLERCYVRVLPFAPASSLRDVKYRP